jgi:hypothetical protein
LAARFLGCHPDTIGNYLERYPQIREGLDAQHGLVVDVAEYRLFEAVQRGEAWL